MAAEESPQAMSLWRKEKDDILTFIQPNISANILSLHALSGIRKAVYKRETSLQILKIVTD